jgi:methylenetetrahydrofolate--tRNA-(uracil-5-)-methyltransferase
MEAPTHDAGGRRIKGGERGLARKRALTARALADLDRWLATVHRTFEGRGDRPGAAQAGARAWAER